jgi:inositol oxygenase
MFRIYELNSKQYNFYKEQHKNQTVDFVKRKLLEYSKLEKDKMSIKMALSNLDKYIDPSDPDLSIPNSFHAYQTAEFIRKKEPDNKAFQICGLIHDLGKILKIYGEPDWAVVGDTFPVGCKWSNNIIFNETFNENPDTFDTRYNSKYGIYEPNSGLDNLLMSFGHDEYMYQILYRNTNHYFPMKYANVIRFHSFYPWHNHGDYNYLTNEDDIDTLVDVKIFNNYDLYSKDDNNSKIDNNIIEYYDNLLEEFFPEPLKF